MHDDSRPWGVLALAAFMAGSFALRLFTGPAPPSRQAPADAVPRVMPLAPRDPGFRALLAGEPIDVNTAPDGLLQQLPGIGPSLSARIRKERAEQPFARLRDLTRVRGLGEAKVAKLAPFLRLPP